MKARAEVRKLPEHHRKLGGRHRTEAPHLGLELLASRPARKCLLFKCPVCGSVIKLIYSHCMSSSIEASELSLRASSWHCRFYRTKKLRKRGLFDDEDSHGTSERVPSRYTGGSRDIIHC